MRMTIGVVPRPGSLLATRSRAFSAISATRKTAHRRKKIPRGQLYVPPPEGTGAPKLRISKTKLAAEAKAKNMSFSDRIVDLPASKRAFIILGLFPVTFMGTLLIVSEDMREQANDLWAGKKKNERGLVRFLFASGEKAKLIPIIDFRSSLQIFSS